MLLHEAAHLIRIALLQSGQNQWSLMCGPLDHTGIAISKYARNLNLRRQLVERLDERGVAAVLRDGAMEAAICGGIESHVAIFERGMNLVKDIPQDLKSLVRQFGDRQPDRESLQYATYFEEVAYLLERKLSDEIPLKGSMFEQALLGESANCLPERGSAHTELPRERILVQAFSHGERSREHKVPELPVDSLIEWNLFNRSQRGDQQKSRSLIANGLRGC